MQESPKAAFFDRIASNVLLVVLILTPFFFVPFLGFGVEVGKTYFIALGVIVAFVCWIIARMIQGSLTFPKTPIVTVAALLPVLFLVSAFFSPVWKVSLSGLFVGTGTVVGIAILSLVFLGSAMYINSMHRIQQLFKGMLAVTGLITLIEIVYLIAGAKYLNLGTFYTAVSNVVGKWNDLALWYALVLIGIMLAFQFMVLSRRAKIVASVIGFFSILFLVVIHFSTLWAVIGFIALLMFVYSITIVRNDEGGSQKFPAASFVILIISLFFFLANPIVGSFVSQNTNLVQNEIRPSFISTTHVFWETIKSRPLVGAGPDRFANAWAEYQPKSIVTTKYWGASFSTGSGYIPTLLITTGIIGGIGILAFMILFLLVGILHTMRKSSDSKTHFYLVATFISSLFLWIMAAIYNPGVVSITLAFACSGIFIGILNASGRIPTRQIYFLKDPRHSFFAILFLVVLLLGSLFTLFTGVEKFASLAMYSRAQALASKNDIEGAATNVSRAIALYPSDMYYRANTIIALKEINLLVSNTTLSKDILKSEFQNAFTAGENSARQAIAYDGTNPNNWINLALLYQNVMPLQIPGAYDNAKAALNQAGKLSPFDPSIDLLRAKLETANKNNAGAMDIVKEALAKKPNYIDGIFFLAELEAADGDSATAIAQLEQVASADPRNDAVFLELGIFKYDAGDYAGAVSALERSITLNPGVLNTHYLLGLSYSKVGRVDEALQVFRSIQKALPDNETISKIVINLESNLPPLTGLQQDPAPLPEVQSETSQTSEVKTSADVKTAPKKTTAQ